MPLPANHIFIIDLPAADRNALAELNIASSEDDSWRVGQRNDLGFGGLVKECGLPIDENARVTLREFTLGHQSSLEDYFASWIQQLVAVLKPLPKTDRICVVLNLMPHHLSRTRVDHLVRGLLREPGNWSGAFSSLLILTRDLDWFYKSAEFTNKLVPAVKNVGLAVVDIRQYGVIRQDDGLKVFTLENRKRFRAILNVKEESIYDALVYDTSTYIGHFVLPNSHVRIHYDLSDFVKKDRVWEYLMAPLERLVSKHSKLIVLGTGLERTALDKLGLHLVAHFEDIQFHSLAPRQNLKETLPELTKGYHAVLVVTDIINSGETINVLLRELRSLGFKRNRVCVFAIAGMRNSPKSFEVDQLEVAVRIQRDFYPAKGPKLCPLCEVGQPTSRVISAEDFRVVHDWQLTPYDFWEIVTETGALEKGSEDPQGRLFRYRIHTRKVIGRYRRWLTNVIRERCLQAFSGAKPDVVLTVNEGNGPGFATLVSQAWSDVPVVTVRRDVLNRLTPSSRLPERGSSPPTLDSSTRVVLADDGINYGDTMRKLLLYCQGHNSIVIGGVVFVNRLSGEKLSGIQHQMARRLISLYDWPKESAKR